MAHKGQISRKLVDRPAPSGLQSCWRLWRICLCRNGFYPLAVAPFVTAAWFLDLYGTLGCNFMHLDVGMKPMNTAWNMTTIDLGLFHHKSEEYYESDTFYMNVLHPGCQRYEGVFEEYFIDGDKTWKMSQYMSFISGSAGGLATVSRFLSRIYFRLVSNFLQKFSFHSEGHDLDDDHYSTTILFLLARYPSSIISRTSSCRRSQISLL